jgi:hypothetical protein
MERSRAKQFPGFLACFVLFYTSSGMVRLRLGVQPERKCPWLEGNRIEDIIVSFKLNFFFLSCVSQNTIHQKSGLF